MPKLNEDQLAKLRRSLSSGESSVDWDKSTANKMFQAIEDTLERAQLTVGAETDTATRPFRFTKQLKDKALAASLEERTKRD
jgi:hypothetical protein